MRRKLQNEMVGGQRTDAKSQNGDRDADAEHDEHQNRHEFQPHVCRKPNNEQLVRCSYNKLCRHYTASNM